MADSDFADSHFDFDEPIDRRGTGSLKWDRYANQDVLPAWVADMDFASPPCIVEALRQRVDHRVFGYTRAPQGATAAVCDYLLRSHEADVDRNALVWLSGCVPALSMACSAAGDPGDGVAIFIPVYPPFLAVHRDARKTLHPVPLASDATGRYAIDFDALEKAIDEQTRVLLFCNPHNPVGRVFTRQEVERVAALCVERDVLLCADEIHCDLILDERQTPHYSALRLTGPIRDRLIVLMAASKTYNVAGLACAFAVVPNERLRRRFMQAAGKLSPEISPLSFAATEAAYREGEPWRQALLAHLRSQRSRIEAAVRAECAPIVLSPIEATYLAWLDVRALGLPDPHRFFEEQGIGFSNGVEFGAPGYVRLNFGTTHSMVDAMLERLVNAVRKAPR